MEEEGSGEQKRKERKPGFTKACKPQNKFLSVSKMAPLFQMPLSQKNPACCDLTVELTELGQRWCSSLPPHRPHSDIHFRYSLLAILKEIVRKAGTVRTKGNIKDINPGVNSEQV